MASKRRQHSADFKFRIALAAVREVNTVSELASQHDVHPTLIRKWKQQLLQNGSQVFDQSNGQSQNQNAFQQPPFGNNSNNNQQASFPQNNMFSSHQSYQNNLFNKNTQGSSSFNNQNHQSHQNNFFPQNNSNQNNMFAQNNQGSNQFFNQQQVNPFGNVQNFGQGMGSGQIPNILNNNQQGNNMFAQNQTFDPRKED